MIIIFIHPVIIFIILQIQLFGYLIKYKKNEKSTPIKEISEMDIVIERMEDEFNVYIIYINIINREFSINIKI